MRRAKNTWLAPSLLILSVTLTAPAFPMVQGDTDPPTPAEVGTEAGEAASGETVESILQQQADLLRGQRFTYDPGGRRDPFRSLKERNEDAEPRVDGILGMSVDEIDLTGIVENDTGDVAYFTGSDNKGYFLRLGEEVYKAHVIAIDPVAGSVTFRQKVDDPRIIKPYRDVVRKLTPLDEESGR
jgi:hypothetical protein